MPKKIGDLDAQILTAAARFRDLVYLAVTDDQFVKKDKLHSFFVSNDGGKWFENGRTTWKCVGMTIIKIPEEKMVAISEDGDVFTYVGGKSATETIEPRPAVLRGVTTLDGKAMAFGMRRQVYRRDGEGRWKPMHAPDIKEGEAAGFEALCGFSLSDVYAAGWEGEIWHYDGRRWRNEDSPVNVILTGATTHDDGKVYICGQNGTLLCGRKGEWEIVADGDTVDDFWSIISFKKKIYVVSFAALYVLKRGHLEIVDPGNISIDTYQGLTEAEGVLWSAGAEDIATFDGINWTKVW
jgi:hypothetical protein